MIVCDAATSAMTDVPSPIDLRDPKDAHAWVRDADVKRPWRRHLRDALAGLLAGEASPVRSVLELGAGPGLLAERILDGVAVERYTLLDFSPAMLAMSRERLGDRPAAHFVLADFKQPDWPASIDAPVDAIVAMQAVHEVRHKQHLPALYRQAFAVLRPGGLLLVCDHEPPTDDARMTALHATAGDQHTALTAAGFVEVTTHVVIERLYLLGGRRPPLGGA